MVGAGLTMGSVTAPGAAPEPAGGATEQAASGPRRESRADIEERTQPISRSAADRTLVARAVTKRKLWTTAPLDVRAKPRERTARVGQLRDGKQVGVTGRRQNGYAEVVVGASTRWVTAEYLSRTKVVDPADRPLSDAPCPDGSSIEGGLQPQSVRVYRAVCAAFPALSAYGGQDGHGEHVNGEAIDFMVPSHDLGEQVKDYLYAHRVELGLFDIIWSQQIWTIERSGEGFRSMSDRGSATANHYDHVHIKIN